MIFSTTVSTTSAVSSIAFTSAPTAGTNTQSLSSSTVSNPSTVSRTLGTSTHCVNVISRYLVQYIPVATRKDKSSSTRVTGPRVSISVEGLILLRKREEGGAC